MSNTDEIPSGVAGDDDYKMRQGQQGGVPVQSDSAAVEDPIDAETADSDETLKADEKDAMDQSNIIEERTRGATQEKGTYTEPSDEEGMPTE